MQLNAKTRTFRIVPRAKDADQPIAMPKPLFR